MTQRLSLRIAQVAFLASALALTACEAPAPAVPPAPPAPPSPPSPELPMTPVKAREIVSGLPLTCIQLASLEMDLVVCDERQGKATDHEALRTRLRDLRWNLQTLPADQQTARCAADLATLRAQPKPQVCWDLGTS